jgi:cytochrome c553
MRHPLTLAFALAAFGAASTSAQGDAAIRAKVEVCVSCHGEKGNSTDPYYPALAGQSSRYIFIQLNNFQERRRADPRMSAMAKNLSRDDMIALGDFFAAQKRTPIAPKIDPAKVEDGRKTSETAHCPACHLANFAGQSEIPRLAGQWPQYLKKQLEDFKARRRTDGNGAMTNVAGALSDTDIENLSQYIATLP